MVRPTAFAFVTLDLFLLVWLHILSCSSRKDLPQPIFVTHKRMDVSWHDLFHNVLLMEWLFEAYFTKSSPDFVNSRGQIISAFDQVDALAQAQSIVYLSIFITQCFNVRLLALPETRLTYMQSGLRRQGTTFLSFWSPRHREQMEFCWYSCRCMPRHVHRVYAPSTRRLWRNLPSFTFVLAHPRRIWHCAFGVVDFTRYNSEKVGRTHESQGYKGSYDVWVLSHSHNLVADVW